MKRKHPTALLIGLIFSLLLGTCGVAGAAHRHHHRRHGPPAPAQITLDLTPVAVVPYVVPVVTNDPARASFLRRMNLENGVEVRSTRWIEPGDVTTRNLFILSVTQSLEGGFDSVNVYDKGVLSWGVMQWTAATDSLPPTLIYVKRRLLQTGQGRVWDKVFVRQGLDVDRRGLIAFGKPLSTPDDMRLAFRGSKIPGNYDPKVATYWATVLARAGRQPAVQQFQREYAQRIVDDVLTRPLPGVPYHLPGHEEATVEALTGGDPYAQALVFALWTNNPRHAREYVADAGKLARQASGSDNPAEWGDDTFRAALLQRCRASRFGNWKQRAALIEDRAHALRTSAPDALTPYERRCQADLVMQKARLVQLASRHKPDPERPAGFKAKKSNEVRP